ncbi:MAG: hypothetical protein K2G59_06460, partial [Muribaculaceae bacterium]|nr:hypothetical protein [Muribaculaceae bacterium]
GKGIEVVVTFNPSVAGFPKVTLNLTGKVDWPTTLPVFGPVDDLRTWTIAGGKNQFGDDIENFEETYKLSPMAYEVAVKNDIKRVNYKGNVLTGRVGNEDTPYILNLNPLQGVYGAPVWDIRVCEENASTNPYYWMVEGSNQVAAVVWNEQNHTAYDLGYISNVGQGKLASDKPDYGYNSTVNFVVKENEAGRILVNSGKPVVLDWNVYLNGKEANNLYTVGHTNMLIMQPITKVFFGEIEPIVQNFAEQNVEVAEYLRACDQYTTNETEDYLNGKGGAFDMSNEGKWNYYGFENPQYSIVTEGLPSTELVYYTQMNIQIDETTGKLTFTTENVTLREPLVVTVNVTVDYAFGSKTAQTQVTISPNSISSHARKR